MTLGRPTLGLSLAALIAIVGGCGGGSKEPDSSSPLPPSESTPARTVNIEMRDIAFEPTAVSVKAGETVTFVFHNSGAIPHDAYIGDEAAQAEHEKEMRAKDNSAEHHGGGGITVEPGKASSITHTFDKPGARLIGCHQAGHYQAGMKVAVTVS